MCDAPSHLVAQEVCVFATKAECLCVLWGVASLLRVGCNDGSQCVQAGDDGWRWAGARVPAEILSIGVIMLNVWLLTHGD